MNRDAAYWNRVSRMTPEERREELMRATLGPLFPALFEPEPEPEESE